MDLKQFWTASRLVIVAGKGGVGKTTVTATLALAAARTGRRVLAIEVEPDGSLARMFGHLPCTYEPTVLASPASHGVVVGRAITAEHALRDYLGEHGLKRIGKRLLASGTLDVVATAAPGIEDILVLGKVKALERGGEADLILLDAPAAGHAISFLQSAHGLLDAVSTGPVRNQAAEVVEMLGDPARCQVVLVTLAEETPVNEAIETAYTLEERVGVSLGPIVVNGIYPDRHLDSSAAEAARSAGVTIDPQTERALDAARAFRSRRGERQREQCSRLARELALEQLYLPFLFDSAPGPASLELLATALDSHGSHP